MFNRYNFTRESISFLKESKLPCKDFLKNLFKRCDKILISISNPSSGTKTISSTTDNKITKHVRYFQTLLWTVSTFVLVPQKQAICFILLLVTPSTWEESLKTNSETIKKTDEKKKKKRMKNARCQWAGKEFLTTSECSLPSSYVFHTHRGHKEALL